MPKTAVNLSDMLRVLVVDAGIALPDAIVEMGFEIGCRVAAWPTVADAFAEVSHFRPHVAIIDPAREELGAVGVIRAMHALAPGCEVIITGVDATSELGLEAVRAGALECMAKNESLSRLRDLLIRAVSSVHRLEHYVPREFAVALKLDGEQVHRYGRFTEVEHRVA